MSEPVKLHRAIRLAQTSRRRFTTLRMTIRDWGDSEKICAAQELPYNVAGNPTHESFHRLWLEVGPPSSELLWVDPRARVRFESRSTTGVRDRNRWWVYDAERASIVRSHETDPSELEAFDAFLHLADVRWLSRRGAQVSGAATVAGRDGIVLSVRGAGTSFDILPGTDCYRYVVDAERGVLLRAECYWNDELIGVEEATEIAFDERFPDEIFAEPSEVAR